MSQGILRKHRRIILVFIIIFIGIPFVLFVPGFENFLAGGPQIDFPQVVGQVGNTPITTEQFLQVYNQVRQSRSQSGMPPTARELVEAGVVEGIMEDLISNALIERETRQRNLKATQDYLVEMLKEDPYFQTADGRFDAAFWNQWIQGNSGANWNTIYEEMNKILNQRLYGSLITAPARVLEKDLRNQFEEQHTKLRVRHARIEPPVTQSEEELRAYFGENQEAYMTPAERRVEFVAISLEAPLPPETNEIVARARDGEDFAELARVYSQGLGAADGGDMGWVVETAALPEHQRVLFTMNPGDVSDPVKGPDGYYIFKVEEDRISALAGRRDVRARQIVLRPRLVEAEREARFDRAQELVVEAVSTGDFEAVANGAGLDVNVTDWFSVDSVEIDGVDPQDTLAFRRAIESMEDSGGISDVIEGQKNLYVAEVIDYRAAEPRSFEEVRDRVERDALNAYKRTEEYRAAVALYTEEIAEKASSLEEIQSEFPELSVEILETEPFARGDFLFSQGVMWNVQEAFQLLGDSEPGTMAGPVTDFTGAAYFLELVERTEPDETVWAEEWPDEREELLEQALRQRQFELQQDYVQYLRDRAESQALVQQDYIAIGKVIQLDQDVPEDYFFDDPAPPEVQEPIVTEIEPVVVDLGDEPMTEEALPVEPSAEEPGDAAPVAEMEEGAEAVEEAETP